MNNLENYLKNDLEYRWKEINDEQKKGKNIKITKFEFIKDNEKYVVSDFLGALVFKNMSIKEFIQLLNNPEKLYK